MLKKIIYIFALVSAFLLTVSCGMTGPIYDDEPITPPAGFKVVGYVPDWSGAPESFQYDKATHIDYAFALPDAAGGLSGYNGTRLSSVVALAHAAGAKVPISVGGWNDGDDSGFETLSAGAVTINAFVTNCASLVASYNLDGVDIDWEYPDSAARFNALIATLSASMHGSGKLCTAAVISGGSTGDTITGAAWDLMDFLTIMAYDGGTPHSPYSLAVSSLDYWTGRGLPAAKAVLGVPFYGTGGGLNVDYKDLVANDSQAPYKDSTVYSGQTVYYNGIFTIRQKTALAAESGGGIMIWELSDDTADETSLLSAIHSKITP
jgi:chitinase